LNLFTWPQTAAWNEFKTTQIFRYLDNETFNPNVKSELDESVLQVAIQRDRHDVVENLLKRSDIRVSDDDVRTLITSNLPNKSKIVAAFKKHKKIPKALKSLL
jgi:ankyrin repeat protein